MSISLAGRGNTYFMLAVVFFVLASFSFAHVAFREEQAGYIRDIVYVAAWIYIAVVVFFIGFGLQYLVSSRRIGLLTFLLGHWVWFSWPLFKVLIGLAPWYGDRIYYLRVSDYNVLFALIYILVFLLLVIVLYFLISRWFDLGLDRDVPATGLLLPRDDTKIVAICLVLFLLGIAPILLSGAGVSEIYQSILQSRSGLKSWGQRAFEGNVFSVIGRSSLVSAGAISFAMIFLFQDRFYKLVFFFFFTLAFIVTYFDSGTRTWTVLIVFPYILVSLVELRGRSILSDRKFLTVAILSVALLLLLALQAASRDSGFFSSENTDHNNVSKNISGDNDCFAEMTITLSAFPSHFDFVYQPGSILFVTNLIPRAIWPDKPYSKVIREYSRARDGWDIYYEAGISRLPSVVGQAYISWGPLGVVQVSVFYALLLAWIDGRWRRHHAGAFYLWLGVATAWVLVSFRGIFPGFHYPVLIIGLIAWLLLRSQYRSTGE